MHMITKLGRDLCWASKSDSDKTFYVVATSFYTKLLAQSPSPSLSLPLLCRYNKKHQTWTSILYDKDHDSLSLCKPTFGRKEWSQIVQHLRGTLGSHNEKSKILRILLQYPFDFSCYMQMATLVCFTKYPNPCGQLVPTLVKCIGFSGISLKRITTQTREYFFKCTFT